MNNTNDLYNRWLAQPDLDDAVKAELVSIAGDSDAVTDRFYRDLEFGTGGLRGVIGAGTNRMNLYTVRKATQGLADYLNASGLPKKVAIAHDSRHNGALFARETARVLAANGITACMYPRLEPTPALSWAVRYLGCGAGVCVTASHNPAKYNGYKVYGADGCQITLEAAEKILAAIEKIDCFDDVRLADFDAADTSLLQIENGKDYVTLVTCTPFGVNTHRLLVRGHRIPYTPEQATAAAVEKPAASSWTQHYLTGLGISLSVVAVAGGGYFLMRRKCHA